MLIKENFSLKELNTFHLPVKARRFVEYADEDELRIILKDMYDREQPVLHIGGGSNLLFLNDFNGMVLHSAIRDVTIAEETGKTVLLRIGAGSIWDDVVAFAADKGWGGIENLSLIPGETGAAAIQNIGAYGVEIKDVVESVEAYHQPSLERRVFSNAACKYDYRNSFFKSTSEHYIITHVTIRLQKHPVYHLEYGPLQNELGSCKSLTPNKIRDAIIRLRRQKLPDPNELGNAGSFFMNPIVSQERFERLLNDYPTIPHFPANNGNVKLSAGWLIEQCGLKGKRMGAVGTYEHHALVIVNYGGATGRDIAQFAAHIRQTVHQQFGIELTPEVKYV